MVLIVVVEGVLELNPVVNLRACSWSNDLALGIHVGTMADSVNKCRDSSYKKKEVLSSV